MASSKRLVSYFFSRGTTCDNTLIKHAVLNNTSLDCDEIVFFWPQEIGPDCDNFLFPDTKDAGPELLWDNITSYCKERSIKMHLVVGNHSIIRNPLIDPYIKVSHFPTYWFTMTHAQLDYTDAEITYPYIMMNFAADNRPHRVSTMDYLCKHDMLDNGAWSWCVSNPELDDQFKWWHPELRYRSLDLDAGLNPSGLGGIGHKEVPTQWNQSWMQIVSETSYMVPFFTEKSVHAIMGKKPFLIAGSQKQHQALKTMGFVLYDELFDYSFDDIEDLDERMEQLVLQVKRYYHKTPHELKQLKESIHEKLEHNHNNMINIVNEEKQIPSIMFEDKSFLEAIDDILTIRTIPYAN